MKRHFILAIVLVFGLANQFSLFAQVVVKNKSQYSKKFIDELRRNAKRNHYKKIELIDSLILLHDKRDYKIYFPTLPKIKRTYVLNASDEDFNYELKLSRKNYSDVDFELALKHKMKIVFQKKGTVVLVPSFVRVNEQDSSSTILAVYFYDSTGDNKDCYFLFGVSHSSVREELHVGIGDICGTDSLVREIIKRKPILKTKLK